MRSFIVASLLLTLSILSQAQSFYPVALIPKELLVRAGAVVRNDNVKVEVKDFTNVAYTEKRAITILNNAGDQNAMLDIWYDKNRQIKSIKGTVFNEFGIPVGKISEKDFSDLSAANDFSLYEDSRIKRYKPAITSYPYTIEYEYEVRSKQSLIFGDWVPKKFWGVAVEKATYTFTCMPSFNIRYKELNYPGTAKKEVQPDGLVSYSWEISNSPALRDEPYSPAPDAFLTIVKIAPEKFIFEGVGGEFSNWEQFGKWMYDRMLKGRSKIPMETAAQITALTQDIADPKEKARKIYEFMQKKVRYISVQVGIGGFQPILASEVDRMSYGDCKGLVNYTQGLLDVAGIKSYYAIVESGSRKESPLPEFANMNFGNHVILCIPFPNDTTWLECTSQQIPFGFLSDFTDDRTVVACTEEGGKLMRTPRYDALTNRQVRKANFVIGPDGLAKADLTTTFYGTQYDNREPLIDMPYTDQVKKLPEIYSLNNLSVNSYDLKSNKSALPSITESLKFEARGYGFENGGSLYIPLNEVNKVSSVPKEVKNRTTPVYINRGYTDVDELTFILPESYTLESYPENVTIEKPFGKFSMNVDVQPGKVIYTRKMQIFDGTYPPDKYEELLNFYQRVSDADSRKIGLVKK